MASPSPAPSRTHTPRTPLVLIIRDGWGMNPHPEHDTFNAVKLAKTPVAARLMRDYPWTLVKTSGEDVGLPDGTMGNSEVGHQNIGAGRIVDQESVAITKACRAGLEHNATLRAAIMRCLQPNKPVGGTYTTPRAERGLHLLGINSDAGVHGSLGHLYAILRACKALGLTKRVYIHLFADGRDTGPFTGKGYAEAVEAACREIGVGQVVSIVGRYYAMDRDHRWERVEKAYRLLTEGHYAGEVGHYRTAAEAFQEYYDHPSSDSMKGDEFIQPRTCGGYIDDGIDGLFDSASRIQDGDSVIFFNYRGDRPREISAAFVFPDDQWAKVKPSPDSGVRGFDRGTKLNLHYVIMTEYWEDLLPHVSGVAFPKPPKMTDIAGDYLSHLGLTQFRCAETEKYPHVTFFFNDYREEPFPGERRENPPSPKVSTYDLKPEMSAYAVCDAVLRRVRAEDCEDVIVVNFANGDMVGHTGNLAAAIRACEVVDECVGTIVDAVLSRGGQLIVAADHGNAEQMFDPATGSPHTAHTIYDVPLIVVSESLKVGAGLQTRTLRGDKRASGWFEPSVRAQRGRLADVMPTALDLMGRSKPASMSGESLLR